MRRALVWSLVAHGFLFVWAQTESILESDEPAQLLAVTISAQPQPILPMAAPSKLAASEATKSPAVRMPTAGQRNNNAAVAKHDEPAAAVQLPSHVAAPVRASAPNAEGLRGYRLALAREARRAWRYPAQALTEGWEGTTEIRVDLLPGGRLAAASIEKTSGHQLLDDAALKMMSSAATSATVPTSLIGDALSVVVPVRFSLVGENQGKEN